jgi:hypothetical protein
MRIIITEEQSDILMLKIEKLLNGKFSDLDAVCKIKVYPNDEGDFNIGNKRFDIHIILRKSYVIRFNGMGQKNLSTTVRNKVHRFMQDFFNINPWGEYFIYVNDCD